MILLLKIFLLILAVASHYVGFKSPNAPPPKDVTVYKGQFFEKVVRLLALASQVSTTAPLISECVVLLSLHYQTPQYGFKNICPYPSTSLSTNIPTLPLTFLLGVSIMLSSAALRVWCYQTLGNLFTFEVSIKPKHRLITSGPYAYVRHPSYTGCVFMLVGAAVTCLSPGSFLNECHIMATPFRWPIYLWFVVAIFATVSLWRRVEAEDEGLREAFGETWNRYSQTVPYRFVPYLF